MSALPEVVHSSDGPFRSFGEQLRAIVKAETATSRGVDPRLYEVQRRGSAAGASEMVPPDGGFLVAPEFSRQIVKRMYETGEIYKRCLEIPITSSSFQFPQFDESSRKAGSRLGGIEAYWENEGAGLKPASLAGTGLTQKPTFNRSEIQANKITGYIHLTDELSLDSDAFETWATQAFQLELLFKIEAAIFNGTGAGMPLGIINAPATIVVPKQGGQAAGTVNSQNINAMLAAFWAASYNSAGSIFLYNQSLLPQLSTLATLVGTAGSESKLFNWATGPDQYDLLAGFPCLMSEYAPYAGSLGDIALVDLSRYILAVRERMRGEISIHVRFLTMENTFRFVSRIGGAPIDRSPVIAAAGGSPPYSTSPFVILAPR